MLLLHDEENPSACESIINNNFQLGGGTAKRLGITSEASRSRDIIYTLLQMQTFHFIFPNITFCEFCKIM